jgi:hypothetical protein
MTRLERAEAIQMYREGVVLEDICERFQRSRDTIRRLMARSDVERRTRAWKPSSEKRRPSDHFNWNYKITARTSSLALYHQSVLTDTGKTMQDPTQAAVREVPIEIFDFTGSPPEGLEAGFYYTIPMSIEDKVAGSEIPLAGPYGSRGLALDAARDFVRDCLTNHTTGEED